MTDRRVHLEEAERERERDRIEQVHVERLQQLAPLMPTDAALRRRQAAEQEAAHTVVAQALGVVVRAAHIAHDGCGGACLHGHGSPFDTAVIALAGEMWVRTFRSREFPRGPTGCESDRRAAIAAVGGDDRELK